MAAITPAIDSEDLDELIADLEAGFGVTIDERGFAEAATFGEVFEIIARQLPLEAQGRCATAMAFYRLRAVLPGRDMRPDARLSDIEGLRYDRIEDGLRRLGWRAPSRDARPASLIVGLMATIGLHVPLFPVLLGASVLTGLVSMFVLVSVLDILVFRNGRPLGAETLGDLARLYAMQNGQVLRTAGGGFNRTMLWKWFALRLGDRNGRLSRQVIFG